MIFSWTVLVQSNNDTTLAFPPSPNKHLSDQESVHTFVSSPRKWTLFMKFKQNQDRQRSPVTCHSPPNAPANIPPKRTVTRGEKAKLFVKKLLSFKFQHPNCSIRNLDYSRSNTVTPPSSSSQIRAAMGTNPSSASHSIHLHASPGKSSTQVSELSLDEIWESLGYMDSQPGLSHRLKSSSKSAHLTPAFPMNHYAKFPLPSLLFCISHQDEKCIMHWNATLNQFSIRHLFIIFVALTLDPWVNESKEMKTFLLSTYPRLSLYSKYLIRKLSLHILMDAKLRPLAYNLPQLGDVIYPQLAQTLHGQYFSPLQSTVKLMDKELFALERYLSSSECVVLHTEVIEAQRQKYTRLFSLFYDEFLDPHTPPSRIVYVIRELMRFADDRALFRFDSYAAFTQELMKHMNSLQGLDPPFTFLDANHPYPDIQFCDSPDSFYFRIIDQVRYPFMSFKLGKAAIDHRRLDVLTTLIRDEGFLYFSSPSLIQHRVDSETRARLLANEEYNILLYAMKSLPRRSSHALAGVYERWGTRALPFLRLILENGGSWLVYPGFLKHAVRFRDISILHYLVRDLGIVVGLEDAIAESSGMAGGEEMAHFLLSHKFAGVTSQRSSESEGTDEARQSNSVDKALTIVSFDLQDFQ